MKVSKNINFIAIMIVLSLVCLLNACGVNKGTATSSTPTPVSQGAVSGNAVSGSAASGAVVSEEIEKTEKEAKAKTVTVTDETGKKCMLKLDRNNINLDDVGVTPTRCWFGDVVWNQVYKNHFYYVCYNKRNKNDYEYIVYKDKGEKVVTFLLPCEHDEISMCIYNDKLYMVLYGTGIYSPELAKSYVDLSKRICVLNLSTGKWDVVHDEYSIESYAQVWPTSNFNHNLPYVFYEDKVYFCGRNKNFQPSWNTWDINSNFEKHILCEYDKIRKISSFTGNLFFMNHKIYYGERAGLNLKLYYYDLENGNKKLILNCNCKKRKNTEISIQIDESYIYYDEYIIPINGGEVIKKPLQYLAGYSFSHNSKYIFYVDTNYKVHRVDKKNLKRDRVISRKRFFSVDCTEDGLYLKKYEKKWFEIEYYKSFMGNHAEGEEEYHSTSDYCDSKDVSDEKMDIYTMDFDGTNLKRNVR